MLFGMLYLDLNKLTSAEMIKYLKSIYLTFFLLMYWAVVSIKFL